MAIPTRRRPRAQAETAAAAMLYEQVAQKLQEQVANGVYRQGERVPSVRRLSDQLEVSISTVVEAYRRLESRGVLEARPQSGYYVRTRLWQPPAQPEISRPASSPTSVSVSALALKVLRASRDPEVLQLGVAVPHPSLLPTRALNGILARIARRNTEKGDGYDFPPGSLELRRQVARRALDAGCTLSPDDIVTTSGCQEALSLCLRAVARAGDTVAIESPAFYGTLQTIEQMGLKAIEIPTCPRKGISIEALRLALDRWKIKACLVVPNFSNPTGAVMPDERKKRLVQLLAEHEVPLIEDDICGDLAHSAPRPKAAKSYDRKGLVMLCSSFSKTLAPGYRVGWVAPGRWREQIEHLKYVNTMATATLPQLAIAEFLEHGNYDHYLRKTRARYAQGIERMTHAVARYFPDGTRVTQPAGGFVLWVEMPKAVDALELHRRALARKILVAPGPLFSPKQAYRNCIRLTCALPWDERLERALVTLGRLAGEPA
ncbi:MAG TPA: PLP-dependent aminotransferase family protein [Sulfuricaulis sp.]|nr:PLP-dependent aminotransferase family protein [Sulfuricaulis sp.]